MNKLRISYTETKNGELKGGVEMSADAGFVLEALANVLKITAETYEVSLEQLLKDLWTTYHVQNRV